MEEVVRHYERTAPYRRKLILARSVESRRELEEIVTSGEDIVIFIVLDGFHKSLELEEFILLYITVAYVT